MLEIAEHGGVVTVNRGRGRSAVVSADHLRDHPAAATPARARTSAEDGAHLVFLEDRPFVSGGGGGTLEAATEDLIESWREYAADWTERLQYAPNHAENWGLVQLVTLSTDEQLAQWLRAGQ